MLLSVVTKPDDPVHIRLAFKTNEVTNMEKRELKQSEKKGISLQDLLLTAVLLFEDLLILSE